MSRHERTRCLPNGLQAYGGYMSVKARANRLCL